MQSRLVDIVSIGVNYIINLIENDYLARLASSFG